MKRVYCGRALWVLIALIALQARTALKAASLNYNGSGALQITALPSGSERIAVDASSNLVRWVEITNAAPASGSLVVSDPDAEGQSSRFYRLSDADDTVDIKGYVTGPEHFGPVANALVEITAGWSTHTDANGYFHFDHRFLRSDLPLTLIAYGPAVDGVTRKIFASDAGTVVPLQLTLGELAQFTPVVGGKYHFQTQSGPRAGAQFTLTLQVDRFQIEGDITGTGSYSALPAGPGFLNLNFDGGDDATINLWRYPGTNVDGGKYLFSGIPSARGILAGNGIVTLEIPGIPPPAQLGSITLHYTQGNSSGSNYTVSLSGGASGYFLLKDGNAPHLAQQGAYTYQGSTVGASLLRLSYATNEFDDFTLTFNDSTTGAFAVTQTTPLNPQTIAGGTFEYATNVVIVAPDSLAGHAYTFAGLTISFFDQSYSVKTASSLLAGGNYAVTKSFNSLTATLIDNGSIAGSAQLTFFDSTSGVIRYQHGTSPVESSEPPITATFFEVPIGNPAPSTLRTIRFQMSQSLLGPYSATVSLVGGSTGTFVVSDGSLGTGTYTYSVSGNVGHLFLSYQGDFVGDFDSFTLQFSTGPGSSLDNLLSGIQRVVGTDAPCLGVFTWQ